MLQHPAVLITIPEWEEKYGTKSYAVDVQEGYIYALRGDDWERLIDRAYVATDEPLEYEYKTPTEKELTTKRSSVFRIVRKKFLLQNLLGKI